jgi:hypothetical protein
MVAAGTDGPATVRAALPGGAWVNDALIRHVDVRVINGADEMALLDDDSAVPAARATALLERCLVGSEVSAQQLSAGDREAVLLQLRRASVGDEVDCVLRCPEGSCGEHLELRISTDEILVGPYEAVQQTYSTAFTIDGRLHTIDYRVARGADLTAAAMAAKTDPQRGAAELLRRCVISAIVDDDALDVDGLDPRAVDRISEEMANHDAQAEILLDAICPVCGHRFCAVFDTASYLLAELDARARRLLTDVHLLARYYHWSESDILSMPPARRDRYLDLIAAELAGYPE